MIVLKVFRCIKQSDRGSILNADWHALTHIHLADTMEKLEKLLPYNIDPLLLNEMRSLPEFIMPGEGGVN